MKKIVLTLLIILSITLLIGNKSTARNSLQKLANPVQRAPINLSNPLNIRG